MANSNTKRDWDYIWMRLSNYATGSNLPIESPFLGVRPYMDVPFTLYVDSSGDDNNPGTSDSPYKTISKALEFSRQWTINNKLSIVVGPGDYDGFWIPDDVVFGTSNQAQLAIQGSVTVLASGTTTSSGPQGRIIDSTADFTTIPIGSMVRAGPAGNLPPIRAYSVYEVPNSTTLYTMGGGTIGNGYQYEVVRLDTNILVNAANNRLASPNVVAIGCNVLTGAQSNRTSTNPLIYILQLKSASTASTSRILLNNSEVLALAGVDFSVGGATSACSVSGTLTISGGIFRMSGSGRSMFVPPAGTKVVLQCVSVLFYGTGSTIATALLISNTNSEFNVRIIGCLSLNVDRFFVNTGAYNHQLGIITANGAFTGASTVFTLNGPGVAQFSASGGGMPITSPAPNAVYLSVNKTASAQIGPSFVIEGGANTTEISVDGAATTLTAFRALTPRAFPASPNVYGTVVYE